MKLCECGCGKPTNPAPQTSKRFGWVAGEPMRYLRGHKHRRHGLSGSPEYRIWKEMHRRCNSPTRNNFGRYGMRGITVCERWSDFTNFLADMGNRPSAAHSIDRINNDKGYNPNNCRWATAKEQSKNTRRNVFISHEDKSMVLRDWAKELGIPYETLRTRYFRYKDRPPRLFRPPRNRSSSSVASCSI